MQLFRHLGLMIAVFWCAAMVVAPIAAAGAGQDMNQAPGSQGMNPGQGNQGIGQMQIGPGQGTGSGNNQQGNGQNVAGPGQGNGPQGVGKGNATGFGNMTPPEKPDRDLDNTTALNRTAMHGHQSGNLTRFNMTNVTMTDIPPPRGWNPTNMTAVNQTGHGHGDGNLTPPAQMQQQGNNNNQGPQGTINQQQALTRINSDDSIIGELISWLNAHGIS